MVVEGEKVLLSNWSELLISLDPVEAGWVAKIEQLLEVELREGNDEASGLSA